MTPPTFRENPPDGRPNAATGPAPGAAARWAKSNLVALGSAAVLTVYAAGYLKTKGAAEHFAAEEAGRRPPSAERQTASAGDGDTTHSPLAPANADTSTPLTAKPPATTAQNYNVAVRPASPAQTPPLTPASAPPASPPPAPKSPTPTADSAAPSGGPDSTSPTPLPPSTPAPAPDSLTPHPSPLTPAAAFHDGTFSGWGTSRHGEIQVTVTIQGGKITDAQISACLTRWSCRWVDHLRAQVVARQSAEVDYVSGATQSGNAFYYAVVEALAKAK